MRPEDHLDILAPDDIRLKGTRIGIETVLLDYLDGVAAAEIARRYPTTTPEQINAVIEYYRENTERVRVYLDEYLAYSQRSEEERDRDAPPTVQRLRMLKRAIQTRQRAEAA